jgi:hypothetical protein
MTTDQRITEALKIARQPERTTMTFYTISKNGVTLWTGEYASKETAIAAYVKDLGTEALDYDAVDPNWKDELEVDAA